MYYEFYIDVFFVVNLFMDFLVLCLTNRYSGVCQTLEGFAGSFGGSPWNLPVFLAFKRDQYSEYTDFFHWNVLCNGLAGL